MLRAPEPLSLDHEIGDFDCGVASLNLWLVRRAAANQISGALRTFVACEDRKVVGFYALASSAVAPAAAPGRFRRNMPDPVPVVVLGRLAVATSHHGQGLGRALFRDAALRVVHAADAIGIRGMVVHALSEEARAFYVGLGLDESPLDHDTDGDGGRSACGEKAMSQHGLCTDQPIASPGEWHFGVARTRAELGDIESARLASRMEALGMRPAGPSEKLIAALPDPVGGRWTDSLVNPDDSARQV